MTIVADILAEKKELLGPECEPEILTLTEGKGFVPQSSRFGKRLATEDTSKYKVVRRHDVAFNPYLLWSGAIARNSQHDRAILSPLYPTFAVREGVDPGYAEMLLTSEPVKKLFNQISFGSIPRRRRASVQDFLSLPLPPLPPLPEQRRIARLLDLSSQTIEFSDRKLDGFKLLKSRAITTHFRQLRYDRQVTWTSLGEIAEVSSGITKGRRMRDNQPLREVPFMAVSNVQAGHLDLSTVKLIKASQAEIDRYRLRRDDILLTEGGDPDKLGRGTLWRDELPESIHQNHIFRVRVQSTQLINPHYLMEWIGSDTPRRYFLQSAKQTTGIASINMRQLRATPAVVPPKDVQRNFLTGIQSIDHAIAVESKRRDLGRELHHAFQYRAFRGEL